MAHQSYMENLLSSGEFSDINVLVGGKLIKAHRCILARSPVFKASLTGEYEEKAKNMIEVKDIKFEVVLSMLRYMYTDKCAELSPELLVAADMYDLQQLKSMCERKLISQLATDNVTDLLQIGDTYNATALKKVAMSFMNRHSSDVFATDGWIRFKREASARLWAEMYESVQIKLLPKRKNDKFEQLKLNS